MKRSMVSLSGEWNVTLSDGSRYSATLPGTLDENGIGGPDAENLATRLTRSHVYEGAAAYERSLMLTCAQGERLFLKVERTRKLALSVNGADVPAYRSGSVSTPWTYELTPYASAAAQRIALTVDNSYSGWPHDAIVYSSAATDETQTNWNGILGEFGIETRSCVFIDEVRILIKQGSAHISAVIDAGAQYSGSVKICCEAFEKEAAVKLDILPGRTEISLDAKLREDARRWDEYDGQLYTAHMELEGQETCDIEFGIREIGADRAGRLTLNGRAFFLRGEANCCEFPRTGHMPLTVEEWTKVLEIYKSYGVNCMRFHSHCPPDAAFVAADRLGIMMQPELSHWNPKTAFEADEAYNYYRGELESVIRSYANHPSFVMLTLGNELHTGQAGIERMRELLRRAHLLDDTRLYAWGSNAFYGFKEIPAENDFYTSSNYFDDMLRATSMNMTGHLNRKSPAAYTYSDSMSKLRKQYSGPVFGFEVGQYEVLPDFEQLSEYTGITEPKNLEIIRERMRERGLEAKWKKYVEATGELSLLCYREEVEAVLRTEEMSGLSLLGLQDFPGQGTALVGMLDSGLESKPYPFADPKRFNAFFRQRLPIALLPGYAFAATDAPEVELKFANYGREDINDAMRWSLSDGERKISGTTAKVMCAAGRLTHTGRIKLELSGWKRAARLNLRLECGGETNEYPLWVYPDAAANQSESVCIARDAEAVFEGLAAGRHVLYVPVADKEHFPHSIASQFSTDFWSVGTFPSQEGAMGCLIQYDHPAFADFPTESHTNWQWWRMTNGRAFEVPAGWNPPVTVMDSYATLRNLALLAECSVGSGRLMICGMGLMENMEHPEVRALYNSLLKYMESDAFAPECAITAAELATMI